MKIRSSLLIVIGALAVVQPAAGIIGEALGWTRDELDRQLARIGETLAAIYRAADEDGFSTSQVAERVAAARLAERAARELPERLPGPEPRHRPEQRHAEER